MQKILNFLMGGLEMESRVPGRRRRPRPRPLPLAAAAAAAKKKKKLLSGGHCSLRLLLSSLVGKTTQASRKVEWSRGGARHLHF
jgi:hypothetical protein